MRKNLIFTFLAVIILVLVIVGCVEEDETPSPSATITPHQETTPNINYHADTSVISTQLSAQGYTVHNVDFTKNKNGFYVLLVMIDTKGNYDKEVLDSYKIMHKNGVADYYVVGIADYEIQSSWSFSVTKNTLDDFFSDRITEDEYIKQVKSEKIV